MASDSDYFFFPPQKSEYFYQQHWESEYFFLEKNHNPPLEVKWSVPNHFGKALKILIVPVFNYNYDRKELTQSQKLGMLQLTLIYQANDPLSL
jgi:hypothetical protein